MPNYTTNLNLVKPIVTELYDIAKVTNENADILDLEVSGKQDILVSGTSIKTINSTSLLGSGDVTVQPTLVSGTNIKTINGDSILGSGDLEIIAGATYTVYTATIPSASWTGSSAPFSKAVTVTGIESTDEPIVDLMFSGTYATDLLLEEGWSLLYDFETSADAITFYAHEIPTIDLPFHAQVVR